MSHDNTTQQDTTPTYEFPDYASRRYVCRAIIDYCLICHAAVAAFSLPARLLYRHALLCCHCYVSLRRYHAAIY